MCNVEAACPDDAPFVVVGGGGFPQVEPEDNAIAMTMNLPVNEKTWRVRWRNMSGEDWAKGKFVVRIKCAASAADAGW